VNSTHASHQLPIFLPRRHQDFNHGLLSTKNPANFFKDFIRKRSVNSNWPEIIWNDRFTAKQRYGKTRVFQFIKCSDDRTVPFPDRFPPDESEIYRIQAASLPFEARQLGREEETWLTQVAVDLRIVETHLSLFSPEHWRKRLRSVTHLQMGMKTQPEIDAVFLARYGTSGQFSSDGDEYVLVTCEAKQRTERILEDQILEQVSLAFEVTKNITLPVIKSISPLAIEVARVDRNNEREDLIHVVQFKNFERADYDQFVEQHGKNEWLDSVHLDVESKALFKVMPPVAGINAKRS
jgi:hypothetical protein